MNIINFLGAFGLMLSVTINTNTNVLKSDYREIARSRKLRFNDTQNLPIMNNENDFIAYQRQCVSLYDVNNQVLGNPGYSIASLTYNGGDSFYSIVCTEFFDIANKIVRFSFYADSDENYGDFYFTSVNESDYTSNWLYLTFDDFFNDYYYFYIGVDCSGAVFKVISDFEGNYNEVATFLPSNYDTSVMSIDYFEINDVLYSSDNGHLSSVIFNSYDDEIASKDDLINQQNQQLSDYNDIKTQNQTLTELNTSLLNRNDELQSENFELSETNSTLRNENNTLNTQLNSANLTIDSLNNENNVLINANNTLSSENQTLKNDNYQLKEQLSSVTGLQSVWDWFGSVFDSMSNVLDLEIAPNVKLSYLLAIPIIVGALFFIVKVLKVGS